MSYLYVLFPLILMPIFFLSIRRGRVKQLAKLTERLRPDAASRGWTLESELRGYVRVLRWKGEHDGIRWVAEALEGKTGTGARKRQTSVTRWRTTSLYAGTTVTLFMGFPEGTDIPKAQPGSEGVLASLALKAVMFALDKAIDLYFGEDIGREVNAADLKRVEDAEPQLEGFAVMSSVPADASRLVSQGVGQAITTAISRGPASVQGYKRPWVLFWRGGVAVGGVGAVLNAAELEPIVNAGLAITRVVRRS